MKHTYNNLSAADKNKLNEAFSNVYNIIEKDTEADKGRILSFSEYLEKVNTENLLDTLKTNDESIPDNIFDNLLYSPSQHYSLPDYNSLIAQTYKSYNAETPVQTPTIDNSSSQSAKTQDESSLLDEDQSESTDDSLIQQIDNRLRKYFYDDDNYYNDIPLYDNKIYSGQSYNSTGSGEGSKINGLYVSHVPIDLIGNKKRSYPKIKYYT